MINGIHRLTSQDAMLAWPYVDDFLEKALIKAQTIDNYGVEYIRQQVSDGLMQLWVFIEGNRIIATCITQVIEYPKRLVLDVPFVGSDSMTIGLWFDQGIPKIFEYMTEQGCSALRGYGRPGWVKHMKKYGKMHRETTFVVEVKK